MREKSVGRNKQTFAVVLLLVICASQGVSSAADRYEFAIFSKGEYEYSRRGSITVGDTGWRVDFPAKVGDVCPYDSVVFTSGRQLVAVNHQRKTWYPLGLSGRANEVQTLVDFYERYPSKLTKRRVATKVNTPHIYEVSVSYNVVSNMYGESVASVIDVMLTVNAGARRLPFSLLSSASPLVSRLERLDSDFIRLLSEVPNEVTSAEFMFVRKFRDGRAMKQHLAIQFEHEAAFSGEFSNLPPANYVKEFPAVGMPAVPPVD